MEMIPVTSSWISAVGYEDGTVRVAFKDGAVYEYTNVSEDEYTALANASSVGRAFHAFKRLHTGVPVL